MTSIQGNHTTHQTTVIRNQLTIFTNEINVKLTGLRKRRQKGESFNLKVKLKIY